MIEIYGRMIGTSGYRIQDLEIGEMVMDIEQPKFAIVSEKDSFGKCYSDAGKVYLELRLDTVESCSFAKIDGTIKKVVDYRKYWGGIKGEQ